MASWGRSRDGGVGRGRTLQPRTNGTAKFVSHRTKVMDADTYTLDGERIPRSDSTPLHHEDEPFHTKARDLRWLVRTAFEDGNQYGPVAMMTFLVLTACITGLAIKGLALMLG